jgi:hydrogenase maturation factor
VSESQAEQIGKIASRVFSDVIFPHLGARRRDILVGPRHGVDAGIIRIGGGQVLAVTTDPLYVEPQLGWGRASWFAVHIVASDAATTGLAPSHICVDLNLPPTVSDGDLEALWLGIDGACREIGLAIITGHTGRYEGCSFPMLGGATVLAIGPEDGYVTPAMARPGDALLMTKGVAIETAALLAISFPQLLADRLGERTTQAADSLFRQLSVVRDASISAGVGVRARGVTSMHDATERGLFGSLHEIAEASGVGAIVDRDAIGILPEVRSICDLFHIDPCTASSEGTLILTCVPDRVEAVMGRLRDSGIASYRIGEIVPAREGVRIVAGGRAEPLPRPAEDAFWPAYLAARSGEIP